MLKRGIVRGMTTKTKHRGKSIVRRKVNMSSCGFVPTHLPLDLTKSDHQTFVYKYMYFGSSVKKKAYRSHKLFF